jgi:hypothetical protein
MIVDHNCATNSQLSYRIVELPFCATLGYVFVHDTIPSLKDTLDRSELVILVLHCFLYDLACKIPLTDRNFLYRLV